MEINVLNSVVVVLLCAMTAFISHMGMAVFHDGIRPVIPEYIDGSCHRIGHIFVDESTFVE